MSDWTTQLGSNSVDEGHMKSPLAAKRPAIRIAVIEGDPLRVIGFRALLDSQPDFELVGATMTQIATQKDIDLVLLGSHA